MNRNMKLCSAPEYEQALAMAREHFQRPAGELYTLTLTQGNPLTDWLVFAVAADGAADTENLNADFNLFYEADGVYLELYPHTGAGMQVDADAVMAYIRRKNIERLDAGAAGAALKSGAGRVKIAPAQAELVLSEDIEVTLADGDMQAYISFLPPDEGGAALELSDVFEKLSAAGVSCGLSAIGIRGAFKEKEYGKRYLSARGVMPEHGADGRIIYHFDTEKKSGAPVESGSGRVDFRSLDLFEPVSEGQLLVTRILAADGKPGFTVKGAELKPRPGREVALPKTRNVVINDDMTEVYAKLSGMVELRDGTVWVSDVYTVKGDCDMSTGNIDFNGSVVITGAVISGMTVRASGDITVSGVVADAELAAGGSVELKRGVQGADKGRITAGGSVTASFIERAEVSAREDVRADVILHSNIEAGRFLVLSGKRGNIMGGRACVGKEVTAKTIGAASHVQTDIEVGLMPAKLARLKFLKIELERLEAEELKIQQIELYLSKAANIPHDKRLPLEQSVAGTRERSAQLLREYTEEYNRLEYEMAGATDGRVHCTLTVYPGVKISIGKSIYKVEEQTNYATFKYRDGSVVFTACEASR